MKPYLIVITGRPGAGKTTLAERLSREWYLPLISRDRVKEGWVHTRQQSHDELPDNSNQLATDAFFAAVECLLDRGVSCIAEAAFQHRIWSLKLPALAEKAQVHIVICRVDGRLALDRFLRRGLNDPQRIRFHGDKGVRMVLEGQTPQVGSYDEPHLPLPVHAVDTSDGYRPALPELQKEIFG